MFDGLTREIGDGVIADVSKAVADTLVAKGYIPAGEHDKAYGAVNYLADTLLNAYLAGKL